MIKLFLVLNLLSFGPLSFILTHEPIGRNCRLYETRKCRYICGPEFVISSCKMIGYSLEWEMRCQCKRNCELCDTECNSSVLTDDIDPIYGDVFYDYWLAKIDDLPLAKPRQCVRCCNKEIVTNINEPVKPSTTIKKDVIASGGSSVQRRQPVTC